MHVALIGSFPREIARPEGGVEAVVGCLGEGLLRKGVELSVIAYGAQRSGESVHADLGCRVVGVPSLRPAGLTFSTLTPFAVQRVVDRLNPDVVHVQALPELYRGSDRPSVLTIHGIPYEDARYRDGLAGTLGPRLRKRSFHAALTRYTRAIAISPYVLRETGLAPGVSRSIPNPVADAFFELKRTPLADCLLCCGVVDRRKNAVALIEAAARLRQRHPNLRYRMAGKVASEYKGDVQRALDKHDLAERFEFLGSLDQGALQQELASCTGLILPSLQETAPMAIQEAMAAGVPVIASAVGGVPEMLAQGTQGTLFDPGDIEDLSQKIDGFLSHPDQRIQAAEAARQAIGATCRVDTVVDATCETYSDAIASFGAVDS